MIIILFSTVNIHVLVVLLPPYIFMYLFRFGDEHLYMFMLINDCIKTIELVIAYRCTTISWRCLQNTYNIRFMSTNINQRYIILNIGYCRVFAEKVSAKTRQYPRFNIMYRWFMFVDIKRMMYVFCKQRQLIHTLVNGSFENSHFFVLIC